MEFLSVLSNSDGRLKVFFLKGWLRVALSAVLYLTVKTQFLLQKVGQRAVLNLGRNVLGRGW